MPESFISDSAILLARVLPLLDSQCSLLTSQILGSCSKWSNRLYAIYLLCGTLLYPCVRVRESVTRSPIELCGQLQNLCYVDQHLLEAKLPWQSPFLNKHVNGFIQKKARENLDKLSEVSQLGKLKHNKEGLTKRLAANSKKVHYVLMPPNHLGIFNLRLSRA